MAKFNLVPDPTFTAKAQIPIPGKAAQPITFTFKWRDRDAYRAWLERLSSYADDVEGVMDIATGWDLSDPWGKETVAQLVNNYIGSARAIIDVYMQQNSGARLGN